MNDITMIDTPRHSGLSSEQVPKVIAEKLIKLLALVGTVEKKGHNKIQNYDFARESDLVDKVRPAMAELGLFLHQTTVGHSFQEQYTTKSGSTMFLTTLAIAFTWVDASGAVYPVPGLFIGYGSDTGDKGVYKAATGAEKYFLMKTFLVSTGDDPEADEKVDKHVAGAAAATGSRTTVRRGTQPGVQRGGKSDVATDAQRAELKHIAKDLGITTGTDLMALVGRIITGYGETPPEWESVAAFGEYLKALDATRMGQLIVAAQKMLADLPQDEPTTEGDDDLDLGYS